MFGAPLLPRLSLIFHIPLVVSSQVYPYKLSFLPKVFGVYMCIEGYLEGNSPEYLKSFISGWWDFILFQFWFLVTGIDCLYTWTQPTILTSQSSLSCTSSDGTPSCFPQYFLVSALLLNAWFVCSLHLPLSFSRAPLQTAFFNGTLLPTQCAFSFHELSGPYVTSGVLPSGLLTWVFEFMSFLDCKLHVGRDWVLLILSPFWLQSLSFSLGDNPFSHWLSMVLVRWSKCPAKRMLSLEFEFWIMGYKDWQWLALIHPGQGALKTTLISSCLPDPWSCSGPWTLRGLLLQIFLRICELSHILMINVSFSLFFFFLNFVSQK